jgi:type II secretory pathway pseudopilin PulG
MDRADLLKMNRFLYGGRKNSARGGFSLVESTLSLGLMSFGFLTLSPLLVLGLKTASVARHERATAEVAQTLIEEAKQGMLTAGTLYLDAQGNPCPTAQAAFSTLATFQPVTGSSSLTRLTLQVTPVGAPDRVRTYAIVFLPPS